MLAKIYKPPRSVMSSGQARTKGWVLEFVPANARFLDPLMGWTGSTDMNSQVCMRFETKDAAIAYAERNGIAHQVTEPHRREPVLRQNGYGDNFSPHRRMPWTH